MQSLNEPLTEEKPKRIQKSQNGKSPEILKKQGAWPVWASQLTICRLVSLDGIPNTVAICYVHGYPNAFASLQIGQTHSVIPTCLFSSTLTVITMEGFKCVEATRVAPAVAPLLLLVVRGAGLCGSFIGQQLVSAPDSTVDLCGSTRHVTHGPQGIHMTRWKIMENLQQEEW